MTISKRFNLASHLNGTSSVSGSNNPSDIRDAVSALLKEDKFSVVAINLSNLESLSPSFAYEAFGKLIDDFGPSIIDRLVFEEDTLGLSKRIRDAFSRRLSVKAAESKAV